MLILFLVGATLALVSGAIAKFTADRMRLNARITAFEFVLGALVCTALVLPLVTVVGVKQARASTVSYPEYWNGWEKTAKVTETRCTRDGLCRHEYACDPYVVVVHYTERVQTGTRTVTRGSGKNKYTSTEPVYTTVNKTRNETRYHRCPYSKVEYTFTVDDTLGDTHVIGDHWVPVNPQEHRYRAFTAVPSNIPSGVPAFWAAAKARLDAGNPGGVTKVMEYENYILASQRTALKAYSSAIAEYQRLGLMPLPATGLVDPYLANKVHFVGPVPGAAAAWQESMMRFNARLGSEKQGDAQLILVTDKRVTSPDEFVLAVQAHWQSPEMGKRALSKNGLVIVAGSNDGGKTVAWTRIFTGMPGGNEALAAKALGTTFAGAPMTPQALLALPVKGAKPAPVTATVATPSASPTASAAPAVVPVTAGKAGKAGKAAAPVPSVLPSGLPTLPAPSPTTTTPSAPALDPAVGGALTAAVFAKDGGFKRACMKGCDGDVGYAYLIEEIQPTGGQQAVILLIGFLFSMAVWGVMLAVGIPSPGDLRSGRLTPARSATKPRTEAQRQADLLARLNRGNSPMFTRLMDEPRWDDTRWEDDLPYKSPMPRTKRSGKDTPRRGNRRSTRAL